MTFLHYRLQDYQIIQQIQTQVIRIQKLFPISINVDELKKQTKYIFQQESDEKIKQQIMIMLQKHKIQVQILQINSFQVIDNQIIIKSNSLELKLAQNGKLTLHNQEKGTALQILANSCIYNGQVFNKKPNGEGCFQWQNGEMYIGQWLNAQKHGFGKWIGLQGDYYIGQWVNGQQDGLGEHNWNGNIYLGQWTNSVKNGYGVEQFSDGDKYIGNYFFGKPQGHGEYRWKNGSVYSGQFFEGKRNGLGKWKNLNGLMYEGEYQNDYKNGIGKLTYPDGSFYYGRFINDMRNGHGIFTQADGTVIEGEWRDNKLQSSTQNQQSQTVQKNVKEPTQSNQGLQSYQTYINSYYNPTSTLNNQKLQLKVPQKQTNLKRNITNRSTSTNQERFPQLYSQRRNTKSTSVDLKEIYLVEAQQTIKKNTNKFKQFNSLLQSNNVKKSIKNVFVY